MYGRKEHKHVPNPVLLSLFHKRPIACTTTSSIFPSGLVFRTASSRQPDVSASASVQSTLIHSSPSGVNGASSISGPSTVTTPSSRREPLASPHPRPSVDDAANWPEVGKSQVCTAKSQRVGNGHAALVEAKDGGEKDTDGPSPSHPGTPKKSEKTKWIPIPPEELQAAADALNPPRPYSQSRNHSQRNSQARSTAASGSGSIQGSQAPSKVASGRTSASHSRVHSPNSMASSPRHPGRGRQLPVDVRGAQAPEQQQRSSQAETSMATEMFPAKQQAPSPMSHPNNRCRRRRHPLITLLHYK
ncbi:hypothetical protein BJV78DRAFT_398444 [Lactifluus subvellereus]|nr:hypothetical protein BJV78DRAFT_398444 [Lactifluus subvellereus]